MYICKREDLQNLQEAFTNEPSETHILLIGSIHVLIDLEEYAKENGITVQDITKQVMDGSLNYMAVNGHGYIVKNIEDIV